MGSSRRENIFKIFFFKNVCFCPLFSSFFCFCFCGHDQPSLGSANHSLSKIFLHYFIFYFLVSTFFKIDFSTLSIQFYYLNFIVNNLNVIVVKRKIIHYKFMYNTKKNTFSLTENWTPHPYVGNRSR